MMTSASPSTEGGAHVAADLAVRDEQLLATPHTVLGAHVDACGQGALCGRAEMVAAGHVTLAHLATGVTAQSKLDVCVSTSIAVVIDEARLVGGRGTPTRWCRPYARARRVAYLIAHVSRIERQLRLCRGFAGGDVV